MCSTPNPKQNSILVMFDRTFTSFIDSVCGVYLLSFVLGASRQSIPITHPGVLVSHGVIGSCVPANVLYPPFLKTVLLSTRRMLLFISISKFDDTEYTVSNVEQLCMREKGKCFLNKPYDLIHAFLSYKDIGNYRVS